MSLGNPRCVVRPSSSKPTTAQELRPGTPCKHGALTCVALCPPASLWVLTVPFPKAQLPIVPNQWPCRGGLPGSGSSGASTAGRCLGRATSSSLSFQAADSRTPRAPSEPQAPVSITEQPGPNHARGAGPRPVLPDPTAASRVEPAPRGPAPHFRPDRGHVA